MTWWEAFATVYAVIAIAVAVMNLRARRKRPTLAELADPDRWPAYKVTRDEEEGTGK